MRIAGFLALFIASNSQAATYYVSNEGSDRANGTSAATAWATLDRVNRQTFAVSDKVLFRAGDRWQGRLAVDWSGTAAAYATVGAYHVENGRPLEGFRDQRPIIEGAGHYPDGGIYDALIVVNSRDYVRITNLEIRDSEGRGIAFGRSNYGDVVDVVVDGTYGAGILFLKSAHGSVSRSLVTHADLVFPRDGKKHPWAAAIAFTNSDFGHVVDTTVSETYGEGINTNGGSKGTVIENNRLYAVRAVGIYADAAPNTTIRRNIVLGTANKEFWRDDNSVGAGIAINNEKYHYKAGGLTTDIQSKNVKIEGNLVANTSSGIALWSALPQTSLDNLSVTNNTLIDNDRQISGLGTAAPGGLLANNVLCSISEGTADVDSSKLSGMTARNNYFSQGDPGADLSHDGNRCGGIALKKTTGWRTIDSLDGVDWKTIASIADSLDGSRQ